MEITEKKTGKTRIVHITNGLRRKIVAYSNIHAHDGHVFDIAPSTYYRAISVAAKHYGYKNISAHSIRKLYAYEYYQRYGLRATQLELQHDNITTTMIYVFDIEMEGRQKT